MEVEAFEVVKFPTVAKRFAKLAERAENIFVNKELVVKAEIDALAEYIFVEVEFVFVEFVEIKLEILEVEALEVLAKVVEE